jgi:Uma2 family endonuclease
MAQETIAPWAEIVGDPDRLMTAEELAALPEDGYCYELVDGRLVRMPPPGWQHGSVGWRFDIAFGSHVLQHSLGVVTRAETGFRVSPPGEPHTVLGADLAFVRKERLPDPIAALRQTYLDLAPDLVMEVASPSQYRPELGAKARLWVAVGTRLVWVVWPQAECIDVWRRLPDRLLDSPVATLHAGDFLDGFDVVPGFQYAVAEFFEQGWS